MIDASLTDPDAEAPDGADLLRAIREGGKPALARALARIEARPEAVQTLALLDAAHQDPQGHVVGLTGPPGVGKSSLANRLVASWRGRGMTVGVIAVDPSSRRSRGALLGDRTRIATDPEDRGVFVRSMAARDRLGGLAELTYPAMTLMRALYDRVLVETVGVGQSETEIADMADTVALCVQPASGDSLQFMKSGVMEVPHLLIVTKADLGLPARRALADLKGALSLAPPRPDGSEPRAIACSATELDGAEAAVEALETRIAEVPGTALKAQRERNARAWAEHALRAQWGRRGLETAAPDLESVRFANFPFQTAGLAMARLENSVNGVLRH
ncbi:methylmalonyl Co-A mutase-associated GTPase MeaB [uncultured Albimonas sp.]|uniref:ArgK/MeaB family GTPase n=1 Tax=uncultured Albimonas sp. TaxID=1331701 RepID=UPI0030EC18C8